VTRRLAPKPAAAPLSCPSASLEWEDAQLIGVVTGTVAQPEVQFVPQRPVTAELIALAGPVLPTEVFRFTARCREGACQHFKGGACGVVAAVVDHIDEHDRWSLPACGIRTTCRWWHERGVAACRRCTLVVTDDAARHGAFAEALSG
jgi:hypothetical protein